MIQRTGEELEGSMGWRDGIRNALPFPSTGSAYKPVFEKIKIHGEEASAHFTKPEFRTFARNLVHTPDNLMEFYSLINLLRPQERSREFALSSLRSIRQILEIR